MYEGLNFYYRVSFGRRSYAKDAMTSNNPDLTHIEISLNSLTEITKIIMKILSEEWEKK